MVLHMSKCAQLNAGGSQMMSRGVEGWDQGRVDSRRVFQCASVKFWNEL